MHDREHRYDTAQVEIGRHLVPGKKQPAKFCAHGAPRWVYRVILILALCVLAVLGWYNRENLTPENALKWLQSNIVGMGNGDGFPKKLSGSSVAPGNFISSEKNIIFASDTALMVYNSSGKELVNIQHSYSSPALCASGAYMMLYNLKGKNCFLKTVAGDSLKFTVKQNIIGGAVAANGHSVLLTAADGYCGMLTAYDAEGKEISYYWFSDYYPTSAAMNPSGTKAAVTGISAKDGTIVSAVYVIDLTGGKTVQPVTVSTGNFLSSVFWNTDSSVEAVGDTGVFFLNPYSGAKHEYSYSGAKLTAFCADDGRVAVGLMPYENSENQKFLVLNSSGEPVLSRQITGKIRSVSVLGQTAAVLAGGKVTFFSLAAAGDTVNSRNAGNDAYSVALLDESSAYVLGISEVRLVSDK